MRRHDRCLDRVARRAARVWPAVWALCLGACATVNRLPAASYERGVAYHQRGQHREAVDTFEQFLRRSPTDSSAASAIKLKALSLMALKEYPVAAVELQILRHDFAGSEEAREAWYLEGLAHWKQVGRVERDVTEAREARTCFRRALAENPDSRVAADARRYLMEISDLMLRKKLGEAEVYAKLEQPAAAVLILGAALEEEQEGSLRPRALMRRAQLALEAGDAATAAACWREVVERHAETPDAQVARRQLAGEAGIAP